MLDEKVVARTLSFMREYHRLNDRYRVNITRRKNLVKVDDAGSKKRWQRVEKSNFAATPVQIHT